MQMYMSQTCAPDQALEAVLTALGLQLPGTTLPEAYPALEAKFKVLWADHGDAISTQYAGGLCLHETHCWWGVGGSGLCLGEGVLLVVGGHTVRNSLPGATLGPGVRQATCTPLSRETAPHGGFVELDTPNKHVYQL